MLETLRRIVQAVGAAADLDEALGAIVGRVKSAIAVDVCSVYLVRGGQYVLMATDGLNAEAVGRVRMEENEGLVGLVGRRREPVNLDDAPAHPSFRYFPETGEERYHAFLGVPIIHYRKLLGVLVVQQVTPRRFGDDELAFLVTIAAQLAGVLAYSVGSGDRREDAGGGELVEFLQGVRGAAGVAVGKIVLLRPAADLGGIPDRAASDPQAEAEAFRGAVEAVREELHSAAARMEGVLSEDARMLFEAYRMVLGSDTLLSDALARIGAGAWAPAALRDTIAVHARTFDDMDDPYLQARGEDIRDIGRRILARLQRVDIEHREYPHRTILVADLLSITQLAEVPVERMAGIVCTRGSGVSHIALLANSLGIPAVMGLGDLPVGRLDGHDIVVDGYRGRVCVDPPASVRREFLRLQREERELTANLEHLRDLPAETPDGQGIGLQVNSGLLADVEPSLRCGAEGVGLYRTEFPFIIRQSFPGEDEQVRVYRQVLQAFAPRPVTMRTLDVGGDKALPYFVVSEENPFLGWRGIRFTLDHPEIFLTQLRALLRADAEIGNLRILLPMVSQLGEVDEALGLLDRALEELAEEGVEHRRPPVGAMVEVPSMVYQAAALARRVDFLSVGTNDLTQYLLAVDRNNSRVAGLYESLHPAVLHALREVVTAAHAAGCPVSVCGEMAGDPAAALLLVGMGVDTLSISASSIPRIKWLVRTVEVSRARQLLAEAMTMEDPVAIREMLVAALDRYGLGGLVRAGK